jgi:hypothetical protein
MLLGNFSNPSLNTKNFEKLPAVFYFSSCQIVFLFNCFLHVIVEAVFFRHLQNLQIIKFLPLTGLLLSKGKL